jgi:hypothetical protein
MIRLLFPLVGLLAHQFKHVQDEYSHIFPHGWRELSSYIVGSLVVWECVPLLLRQWGMSKEDIQKTRHAHLQTLAWFGGGVAVGWVVDAVLVRRQT